MSWKLYPEHKPPVQELGECKNYPVAFYDDEIGLIVDQAEYHASWPVPWVFVGDGRACHPYAWYDLPDPPEPPTSSDCGDR